MAASQEKRLINLIQHLPEGATGVIPDLPILGITQDSRLVQPGYLFVALEGGTTDGHRYIPNSIARGAVAIVGTRSLEGMAVPYLRVNDGRQALAYLSAVFYDLPARQLTVIGVTGTDGKTTTANLIYHILLAAGIKAGMITTVNAQIGDQALDTGFHVTTPEAPKLQGYLAQMVAAGLTHVVLEATSHGLDQQRLAACDFDLAVVTNITHEHLDYHGTYEAYRAAKGRLLTELARTPQKPLGKSRAAIINRDDGSFEYLEGLLQSFDPPVRRLTYGQHPEARLRATDIESNSGGQRFIAIGPGYKFPVKTHLVGSYNVSNCLAAIAATVEGLSIESAAAQAGIAVLGAIPGRMEVQDMGQDFLAIVDFAHTPNALRRVLETARQLTSGRVIAIFGSAGLRDRAKRRLMAETSADLADLTVLTAEDPRTESLEVILAEMTAGIAAHGGVEGKTFWRIPDRGEAIQFGLSLAQPGDVVIACGKGHEQSMCFGDVEHPWDDRTAMQAALADLLGQPGPEMPYLPTQKEK